MKISTLKWLAAITALLIALSGYAGVNPANWTGFASDKAFAIAGPDAVNTFNGNVVLTVPIGQEYGMGDGLRYSFSLSYNSTVWEQEEITYADVHNLTGDFVDPLAEGGPSSATETIPDRWSNAGLGWFFSLGELRYNRSSSDRFRYSYVTPDGANHFFYETLHADEPTMRTAPVKFTRDGSYMRLRYTQGSGEWWVDLPDGRRQLFICEARCDTTYPIFLLSRIHDARGNVLYFEYSSPTQTELVWTIKEGSTTAPIRTHYVRFEPSLYPHPWRLKEIDIAAIGDTAGPPKRAKYTFQYKRERVFRDGLNTLPPGAYRTDKGYIEWYFNGNQSTRGNWDALNYSIYADLLTSITMPGDSGGVQWKFSYYEREGATTYFNTTDASATTFRHTSCDSCGRLKRVTLPTKGGISYVYGRWGFPRRNCEATTKEFGDRLPSPNFGRWYYSIGVRRRQLWKDEGTADASKDGKPWMYFGYSNVPDSFDRENCDTPPEYQATVVDPLGTATVSYYSIYLSGRSEDPNPDKQWSAYEYGMPFTRADVTGDHLLLSQKTFECKDKLDPDASDLRVKVRDITAATSATCGLPVLTKYVSWETSTVLCSGDYSGPDCLQSNRRLKAQREIYRENEEGTSTSSVTTTWSDFDGLGNFREVRTANDYVAKNFPQETASDAVVKWTNYNPGINVAVLSAAPAQWPDFRIGDTWLITTYDEERVCPPSVASCGTASAGSSVRRTLFDFEKTIAPGGNVRTGVMKGIRRLTEPAGLRATDVLTVFSRNVVGNEVRVTEDHYGADRGGVSTSQKFGAATGVATTYRIYRVFQFGSTAKVAYQSADSTPKDVLVTTNNTIDAATGLVTASTDPSGLVTRFYYDSLGRLTRAEPPGEDSIGYVYTPASTGATVTIQRPHATGATYYQQITYDGWGRVAKDLTRGPNGDIIRTIAYLPTGAKSTESTPHKAGQSPSYTTYSDYDSFGRPELIVKPDGFTTKFTYSGRRVVEREDQRQGSSSSFTWESYDAYGRLVNVVDGASRGANSTGAPTRYQYDLTGNLVTVTQGRPSETKQIRSFSYDKRGFATGQTIPEIASVNGRASIEYGDYDALGHARSQKIPAHPDRALTFEFDRAERQTQVVHQRLNSTPQTLKEFRYYETNTDDCGETGALIGRLKYALRTNFVRDPADLRRQMEIKVREDFVYDHAGKLKTTRLSHSSGSNIFSTRYTYDSLGQLLTTTYPTCTGCPTLSTPAVTITGGYTYGSVSRITGTIDGRALTLADAISYHPSGLVHEITHGNRVKTIQTPDPNGLARPLSIYTRGAQSNGADADWNKTAGTYQYDGLGNVTAIGNDVFGYDNINRLTSACLGGASQSFEYDGWGNLLRTTQYANCAASGAAQVDDFAVSSGTNRAGVASYDAAGNVTALNGFAYEHDAFNMMNHVWKTGVSPTALDVFGRIHLYTAFDERVATIDYRIPNGDAWTTQWKWTLRDQRNNVLREVTQTGDDWEWVRDYVRRGSALFASLYDTAAGVSPVYYHLDHLGTTRYVTKADGSPKGSERKYWPFGEDIVAEDDAERFLFTGHERDDNDTAPGATTGDLDYMHARYYSGAFGRFLSVDPQSGKAGAPQSWNRYAYSRNNPIVRFDPDGREDLPASYHTGLAKLQATDVGKQMFQIIPENYVSVTTRAGATAAGFSMKSDAKAQVFATGTGAVLAIDHKLWDRQPTTSDYIPVFDRYRDLYSVAHEYGHIVQSILEPETAAFKNSLTAAMGAVLSLNHPTKGAPAMAATAPFPAAGAFSAVATMIAETARTIETVNDESERYANAWAIAVLREVTGSKTSWQDRSHERR